MFKSVQYVGFEGRPDLKAKAEQLTPVLADEIRRWREGVAVKWSPHPDAASGVLDLTLSLTLQNGVSGTHTGSFTQKQLDEDCLRRGRCRLVWDDLLGVLLDEQHKRVEEGFLETAEA